MKYPTGNTAEPNAGHHHFCDALGGFDCTCDEWMLRDKPKEILEMVWRLGDDLDSNHARWAAAEVAKRYGIELWPELPPVNEPNNRLREQLAVANDEIDRLKALMDMHECWDGDNFIRRGVGY
jgi:hypothetical protein